MKSTLLFFVLLVFVSCSIDSKNDQAFIELTRDPSAEAIFATMSVHLKQAGGFDRILALLNSLVDDAKKQLSEMTVVYSKTSARCDVTTQALKGQQDFFTTRTQEFGDLIKTMTDTEAEAAETLNFMALLKTELPKVVQDVIDKALVKEKYLSEKAEQIKQAVTIIEGFLKQYGESEPLPTQSFLQEKVEKVTSIYLQVKSIKIFVPKSFLQVASDDVTAKKRIFEWFGLMKVTFLDIGEHVQRQADHIKKNREEFTKVWQDFTGMCENYAVNSKTIESSAVETIKTAQGALDKFNEMLEKNRDLIKSNDDYCKVETSNFATAQEAVKSQIVLFKDIRDYFINNYNKIVGWIQEKYKREVPA